MSYHQKGRNKGYVLEWNRVQHHQKRRRVFKTKAFDCEESAQSINCLHSQHFRLGVRVFRCAAAMSAFTIWEEVSFGAGSFAPVLMHSLLSVEHL